MRPRALRRLPGVLGGRGAGRAAAPSCDRGSWASPRSGTASWSDAGFIILALAGVTYDGLQETAFWGSLMQPIFIAVWEVFGALNTVLIIQTLGLAAVWIVFLAVFTLATAADARAARPGATSRRRWAAWSASTPPRCFRSRAAT